MTPALFWLATIWYLSEGGLKYNLVCNLYTKVLMVIFGWVVWRSEYLTMVNTLNRLKYDNFGPFLGSIVKIVQKKKIITSVNNLHFYS